MGGTPFSEEWVKEPGACDSSSSSSRPSTLARLPQRRRRPNPCESPEEDLFTYTRIGVGILELLTVAVLFVVGPLV